MGNSSWPNTSICFLCLTFYWHPKTFTWQCHLSELRSLTSQTFTNLFSMSSNWDDWFSQTILTVSVQCSPIIPPRTKNLLEVPKALAAHIDHHQPAICNSLSLYLFQKQMEYRQILKFPGFWALLKEESRKTEVSEVVMKLYYANELYVWLNA